MHEFDQLRIPGLGGQDELVALQRGREARRSCIDRGFDLRGLGKRREPLRQSLVQPLFRGGFMQRVEAGAPHHRIADQLRPGSMQHAQADSWRHGDLAPAQALRSVHHRQHGLVELYVEMQHRLACRQVRASRDRGIDAARDRYRKMPRDAEGETDLPRPHGAGNRERQDLTRAANLGPEERQVRFGQVRVGHGSGPGARQCLWRQLAPEAVDRERRPQPRGGGGGRTDHDSFGRNQRNARARDEALAIADGEQRRVHDLEPDRRHRQRTCR